MLKQVQGSERAARRVLVVDDDIDFGETLAAVLEDAGFDVLVASGASEALGLLGTFTPDAAVVDIRMPVVDGHALLAIMKNEPSLRTCKFVAISGQRDESARESGEFNHFFRKPLETSDLISVLEAE